MKNLIINLLEQHKLDNRSMFTLASYTQVTNPFDCSSQQTALITSLLTPEDEDNDEIFDSIEDALDAIHHEIAAKLQNWPKHEVTESGVHLYYHPEIGSNLLICYSDYGLYITYTQALN